MGGGRLHDLPLILVSPCKSIIYIGRRIFFVDILIDEIKNDAKLQRKHLIKNGSDMIYWMNLYSFKSMMPLYERQILNSIP